MTPAPVAHRVSVDLFAPEVSADHVRVNGVALAESGDVVRIRWVWGDGTMSDHHWFPGEHRYSEPGTYRITVTASDASGASATVSILVEVQGTSEASCVVLISPDEGAVMDNGRLNHDDVLEWDFSWEPCSGAERYHLQVTGPTATNKLVDEGVSTPAFHLTGTAYVAEINRYGWRWRVRAIYVDGPGPWSAERTFDVEPVNSDTPLSTP